jgi:hypothetical protein
MTTRVLDQDHARGECRRHACHHHQAERGRRRQPEQRGGSQPEKRAQEQAEHGTARQHRKESPTQRQHVEAGLVAVDQEDQRHQRRDQPGGVECTARIGRGQGEQDRQDQTDGKEPLLHAAGSGRCGGRVF